MHKKVWQIGRRGTLSRADLFDKLNASKACDSQGTCAKLQKGVNTDLVSASIPQDLGLLHFDCGATRPGRDTVPYPRPYKTMDNDSTYTQF